MCSRRMSRSDPHNEMAEEQQSGTPWRQNCTSLEEFSDEVEAVSVDQAARGR